MNTIQQKLLELAEKKNLGNFTLREIGGFVGETSPQKIKHHLQQLAKRGFININKMEHTITTTKQQDTTVKGILKNAKLLSIPILGAANAGPAMVFANSNIEGYLRV